MKKYPKRKFEVGLPSTWEISEYEDKDLGYFVSASGPRLHMNFGPNYRTGLPESPLIGVLSIDLKKIGKSHEERMDEIFKRSTKNFAMKSKEPFKVCGLNGWKILWERPRVGPKGARTLKVFVGTKSRAFEIKLDADSRDFQRHLPVFNKVLESFKIIE